MLIHFAWYKLNQLPNHPSLVRKVFNFIKNHKSTSLCAGANQGSLIIPTIYPSLPTPVSSLAMDANADWCSKSIGAWWMQCDFGLFHQDPELHFSNDTHWGLIKSVTSDASSVACDGYQRRLLFHINRWLVNTIWFWFIFIWFLFARLENYHYGTSLLNPSNITVLWTSLSPSVSPDPKHAGSRGAALVGGAGGRSPSPIKKN